MPRPLALVQTDWNAAVAPILETANDLWLLLISRLPHLFLGLLVILFAFAITKPVSKAICRVAERSSRQNVAEVLNRLIRFVLIILSWLVAAVILFPNFKPGDLIAGLGITSVAIGFAFKDILQNFFAGILILWREPFSVGDEIRSGDYEGLVEEINTRSTRIRTYDGERAILPNGEVYTRAVLVRTAYDKRRVTFTVGIGYPFSIEEARRAIHRVLAETEGVLQDPGPWVYVTELAASSVDFTVYFWTHSPQRKLLETRDRAITAVKKALDKAEISIPYPHSVVLFHDQTGTREDDVPRVEAEKRSRDDGR